MDMALGEPPLLPWWARYIHLQRVADRLGDDIYLEKPLDRGDWAYPIEGRAASPKTWRIVTCIEDEV